MNEKVCEMLKAARKAKGLKQTEVAQLMGLKSDGTISNWEKGISEPDIDSFVKVCRIYGVDFAELLTEAYGSPIQEIQQIECSNEEIEMLEKYRALNVESRDFIKVVLDHEYETKVPLVKKNFLSKTG